MSTITQLPPNNTHQATLDLSTQHRVRVGLLIASIVLIIPVGWVLWYLTVWLRPAIVADWSGISLFSSTPTDGFTLNMPVSWLGGIMLATLLVIPLHELVHGVFFWVFTKRLPIFGIRLSYAYAAAPAGVYIPRNQYLVVTLAPLILLNLVGLLLIASAPLFVVPTVFGLILLNTVGAVGDILVTGWLLQYPSCILVQDIGDCMTIYGSSDK